MSYLWKLTAVCCVLLLPLSACNQGSISQPARKPLPAAQPYMPPLKEMAQPEPEGRGEVSGPKVKIGVLLPLSGEAAELGQALMDAATLALFDKYATLKNSDIHTEVVLLPKDTEGTPKGAAIAARAAIAEGAQLLVGPLFSDSVRAITPIAQQHNISAITFSNNKDVAERGIYVSGFMPKQQVTQLLDYSFKQNKQKVAALLPSNTYGHLVADALRRMMVLHNKELVGIEFYPPSAQSMDVEIQRLLGTRTRPKAVDAILLAENGAMLETVLQRLRHFGYSNQTVQLLGTGIWDDPALPAMPELQGGWFASSPLRGYQGFAERFTSQYRYSPPRLASLAYDGVALATTLAQNPGGAHYSSTILTDPNGFRGPANGIFRLRPNGMSERGLAILGITETGFKEIFGAPRSFQTVPLEGM